MTDHELDKKSLVTISLPRAFLTRFNECHLWEEYASFTDLVRDAVRKTLDHYELVKKVQYTTGERIQRRIEENGSE